MAVLVTFGRLPPQSDSWRLLLHELDQGRPGGLREVVVYDNSSSPWPSSGDHPNVIYVHDPENGGTGAAYFAARTLAVNRGAAWLLLLDQDTLLPQNFFELATRAIAEASADTAALLPFVQHDGRPVSPARVTWTGSIKPLRPGSATAQTSLTGIASGAIIRLAAFQRIDHLPTGLWLDYVDHWIFARLRRENHSIGIIPAVLEHELSLSNPASISIKRLHSILQAEQLFTRELAPLARVCYPFRLLVRAARWRSGAPGHAKRILQFLIQQ